MKKEEVLSKLCYYDKRNPDNIIEFLIDPEDLPKSDNGCYCDNCFYGRTKMAEYILQLEETIDHHRLARGI